MPGDESKGIDGHLFRLIATFEAAAMQQMGKVANPLTGDVEISLEGARDAIEMLDMLRLKTSGNLNDSESRFLEHVLYQLRMNYVDVAEDSPGPSDAPGANEEGGNGEEKRRAAGDGDGRGDAEGTAEARGAGGEGDSEGDE